jgi:hypothetical protein
MLGHEWFNEKHIFITAGYTHVVCCWSHGFIITISYIGNTTLIREAKKKSGRLIH